MAVGLGSFFLTSGFFFKQSANVFTAWLTPSILKNLQNALMHNYNILSFYLSIPIVCVIQQVC